MKFSEFTLRMLKAHRRKQIYKAKAAKKQLENCQKIIGDIELELMIRGESPEEVKHVFR